MAVDTALLHEQMSCLGSAFSIKGEDEWPLAECCFEPLHCLESLVSGKLRDFFSPWGTRSIWEQICAWLPNICCYKSTKGEQFIQALVGAGREWQSQNTCWSKREQNWVLKSKIKPGQKVEKDILGRRDNMDKIAEMQNAHIECKELIYSIIDCQSIKWMVRMRRDETPVVDWPFRWW